MLGISKLIIDLSTRCDFWSSATGSAYPDSVAVSISLSFKGLSGASLSADSKGDVSSPSCAVVYDCCLVSSIDSSMSLTLDSIASFQAAIYFTVLNVKSQVSLFPLARLRVQSDDLIIEQFLSENSRKGSRSVDPS